MKLTKLEHSGLALEQAGQTLLCDPVEFTEKLPDFTNVVAIIITHQHSDHLQPAVLSRLLAAHPQAQIFAPEDAAADIPTISDTGVNIDTLQPNVNADPTPVASQSSISPGSGALTIPQPGTTYQVGSFRLAFFGRDHASIIPGQVPCRNLGVIINDLVVNPGDSFDLPSTPLSAGSPSPVSTGSVNPSAPRTSASLPAGAGSPSSISPLTPAKVLLMPISAPWCKISDCLGVLHSAHPELVIPIHDAVLSLLGRGFSNNILQHACQSAGVKFQALAPGESVELTDA